jgi:hypothetical protein
MIVTTTQWGAEPPVQRLHFMQDNVEPGWQGDFFDDIVLSVNDLNTDRNKRLTLRIQVYDMDRFDVGLVTAVAGASQSVAVAFPQLAPYVAAVSFAAPALAKLVENIDDHDKIIDERLALEIAAPGTGHNLLQPGYFVCFRQPQPEDDIHRLYLDNRLRVVGVVDKDEIEFCETSYAVLEMEDQFLADREREIDQKVAKLMAELGGKGQSGRAAIEFLRETMDLYDRYRRLQRARHFKLRQEEAAAVQAELANTELSVEKKEELEARAKELELTEEEATALTELEDDENLKPFLMTQRG